MRRAPNVAYDNPGTTTDGLRTADQFDMFNGAVDRYDWRLAGKREMVVPYNAYKLHSDDLSFDDILTPLHVNPEHLRYELHRVWVVEATLKEGARHLYKRRTFYLDEDSWQILLADVYDNRDQLWRVSEGHVINYYEKPLVWPTLEVHTDLQAGRYPRPSGSTTSSTCAPGMSNSHPGTSRRRPCVARVGVDARARAIVNTVREAAGEQVATKADLAALEDRSEAKLAGAVNKMLIARIAVGG